MIIEKSYTGDFLIPFRILLKIYLEVIVISDRMVLSVLKNFYGIYNIVLTYNII
jgi:hypothetical protein